MHKLIGAGSGTTLAPIKKFSCNKTGHFKSFFRHQIYLLDIWCEHFVLILTLCRTAGLQRLFRREGDKGKRGDGFHSSRDCSTWETVKVALKKNHRTDWYKPGWILCWRQMQKSCRSFSSCLSTFHEKHSMK